MHATLWATNAVEVWSSADHAALLDAARTEAIVLRAPARYVNILAVAEAGAALAIGDWSACAGLLRNILGSGLAPLHDAQSRLTAARLAALQGRSAEAMAHLERAEEICSELAASPRSTRARSSPRCRSRSGHPEDAARTALERCTKGCRPTMCEWLVPLAARALADQQQRRGSWGRARRRSSSELAAWRRNTHLLPTARAERPSIPSTAT